MKVLLLNPPHPAIGSRIPLENLPPLGLLAIGGPLIDAGHRVRLLNGDLGPLSFDEMLADIHADPPDAILIGHSGSTSGHPIVAELTRRIARELPHVWLIYGGVFPSYHWREVLASEPQLDFVVRGEGEETTRRLMSALEHGEPVDKIPGIAYRSECGPVATPATPVIRDLDAYRVGWELIDFRRYSYWGGKRAVVVQFSRGCPHLCNYCGQRGFWTRWRHRDPVRFADEIARLHREHGVQVFNFADENPSANRVAWKAFLQALIRHNLDLTLVGSTRADDIVRDADILPLYKKAGFERFLMGMENTDEATLLLIRKGGCTAKDREAIRLLREHGILSMATWVTGFEEETDKDLWRGLRQLLSYDPDQIQALYVTPHRWTPFFRIAADRTVIQTDVRRWDYKHQVLSVRRMAPWRVFVWVKFIEAVAQLRPRALRRLLFQRDPKLRHATRWYYRMGRRVWFHEIRNFLFRDARGVKGPSLREFWGEPQEQEEQSMVVGMARGGPAVPVPSPQRSAAVPR